MYLMSLDMCFLMPLKSSKYIFQINYCTVHISALVKNNVGEMNKWDVIMGTMKIFHIYYNILVWKTAKVVYSIQCSYNLLIARVALNEDPVGESLMNSQRGSLFTSKGDEDDPVVW